MSDKLTSSKNAFDLACKQLDGLLSRVESQLNKQDRTTKVEKSLIDLPVFTTKVVDKGTSLVLVLSDPVEKKRVEDVVADLQSQCSYFAEKCNIYVQSCKNSVSEGFHPTVSHQPSVSSKSSSSKSRKTSSSVRRLQEQKLEAMRGKLKLERELELDRAESEMKLHDQKVETERLAQCLAFAEKKKQIAIREIEDELKLLDVEERSHGSNSGLSGSQDKVGDWLNQMPASSVHEHLEIPIASPVLPPSLHITTSPEVVSTVPPSCFGYSVQFTAPTMSSFAPSTQSYGLVNSYTRPLAAPFVPSTQFPQSLVSVPQVSSVFSRVPSSIQTPVMSVQNLASEERFARSSSFEKSLPKWQLSVFGGDPLQWPSWKALFLSTIGSAKISNAEKMNHLLSYVSGKAKTAIEGLPFSDSMYSQAWSILERKFGKPHVIVSAHLDKISKYPSVRLHNSEQIVEFSTVVSNLVNVFREVRYEHDLYSSSNLQLVSSKLPPNLREDWNKRCVEANWDLPSLVDFDLWLQTVSETHERLLATSVSVKPPVVPNKLPFKGKPVNTFAAKGDSGFNKFKNKEKEPFRKCPLDSEQHPLWKCPKFEEKSPIDRAEVVKNSESCFRCLRTGHFSRDCTFTKKCEVAGCGKNHHTLLHDSVVPKNDQGKGRSQVLLGRVDQGLLQVVPVRIHSHNSFVDTLALCDTGSTHSWVEAKLAQSLGLKGPSESIVLNSFQQQSVVDTTVLKFEIGACHKSFKPVVMTAYSREFDLGSDVISVKELKRKWPHLADVELDQIDYKKIKVLIGQNMFALTRPLEYKSISDKCPWAVRIQLGWVLSGPLPVSEKRSCSSYFVSSEEELLSCQVKKWWDADSFSSKFNVDPRSAEDKRALALLDSGTQHTGERYSVGLLWAEDSPQVENNYCVAYSQFLSLERRLGRDSNLKAMYRETVHIDIEKGYVEKVNKSDVGVSNQEWYLPHHPVVHPNKPDKVRRVCNAASKFRGKSLNDSLLIGPDLLNSLLGVIMRFRQEQVGITADIEGMFLQVEVPVAERPFLRILWREDPSKEIEVYQYSRHIFGAKDSPAAAIYALHRTAKDNSNEFDKDVVEVVLRNFYMDDMLKSVRDNNSAVVLVEQLCKLLRLGGFNLTKFVSNVPEVQAKLPKGSNQEDKSFVHVLGLKWCLATDSLQVCRGLDKASLLPPTQRSVLRVVASVFDPVGIAAPLTIKGRLLFKKIWQVKGQAWDQELSDEHKEAFSEWTKQLVQLPSVVISRRYFKTVSTPVSIQAHVFGDASLEGICAVVYFRTEFSDSSVEVSFVVGKARVAPMKQLTIPKLELQASVLACNLLINVRQEHDLKIDSVVLWSDSSTVIQWIRSSHKKHQVFVANRIAEILDSTSVDEWRHVPGELNPSDCGTRGLTVEEFSSSSWLNGPAFLKLPMTEWPQDFPISDIESLLEEEPSEVLVNSVVAYVPVFKWSKFSLFKRLVNTVAIVLRVRDKAKGQQFESYLSAQELSRARIVLWKQVQKECFSSEIAELSKDKSCPSKSVIVSLSPFVGSDGLVRAKGRLRKADLPYSSKHPILLKASHPVVELFLRYLHFANYHQGVEYLRSVIQQEFWIVGLRTALRAVKFSCVYCRKRGAQSFTPEMADLPSTRLQQTYPFASTGVDYFGPFQVKWFRKTVKRWCCLFTCLTTRAVHIEVVESADTSSCLMAISRFVSRRGKPKVIVSDNGTNFVGSANEMKEWMKEWEQSGLSSSLAQQNIEWRFNPPAAPHFGGVWERLVRSCKKVMFAVLGPRRLSDEVLRTVMCIVEQTLNARPLTAASSDSDDLEALTPFHFLLGRPGVALPSCFCHPSDVDHRKLYRQCEAYLDMIWSRWQKEYCPSLNVRAKWQKEDGRFIQVGDLVWIIDNTSKRGQYPLARVLKVFPGDDGVVRSAEVKSGSGVYTRPVVRLVPLPLRS